MIIKTWRDPYEAGFTPTRPKEIELNPGLTVLVGCNGAGKTTLLLNIKEECEKQNIPVHHWNNLSDGGYDSIGSILGGYGEEGDDIAMGVSLWSSSEGEAIKLNLKRQSRLYEEFLKTGYYKDRKYKFSRIFCEDKEEITPDNRRVLLFDATDSGLSVDSIVEIKSFFDMLLENAKKMGLELYLIISANEYELARNSNCFDVNEGKYINFVDYEDYRKFIINSREKKEKRIEKQIKWQENKRLKNIEKAKHDINMYEEKINSIKEKAKDKELTWKEKYEISNMEREIIEAERVLKQYKE